LSLNQIRRRWLRFAPKSWNEYTQIFK